MSTRPHAYAPVQGHTHAPAVPGRMAAVLLTALLMVGGIPAARAQAQSPTQNQYQTQAQAQAQTQTQTQAQAQAQSPVAGAAGSPTALSAVAAGGHGAVDDALQQRLQMLAMAGARQVAPTQARVEVELGRLDPRLRLAPCEQIQPYLPPGLRMWGRTRIGLRCLSGPTKWNVSLPLTIKVYGQAYVSVADLPVGTELTSDHLRLAEIDIAGDAGAIYTQPDAWQGRRLAKPLAAGEALRSSDLKLRQWVQPGDRVQVLATGQGYAVAGEGQAIGVGLEGQDVRVRFDNGRMVTGRTVGERRVEVPL
ncbi:flagellar basal body P-ring formation chaperone FlgA [Roseateles amylovorans]|uniref:Flagellar basal body P-ring formation chaperone FlgA n=1 Tax=Roseateles amylovorans TaxID=2978473 RepID=A0ABY6B379_9BURK|nr:flagellar basal body P-ring formation chaperone FlgA [Roseateles amylovorans]UXH79848.1 flagellar basal body P-ring formation chaperone FlgA [Roseateles amylovorans]